MVAQPFLFWDAHLSEQNESTDATKLRLGYKTAGRVFAETGLE
jgi:hypothetical protein